MLLLTLPTAYLTTGPPALKRPTLPSSPFPSPPPYLHEVRPVVVQRYLKPARPFAAAHGEQAAPADDVDAAVPVAVALAVQDRGIHAITGAVPATLLLLSGAAWHCTWCCFSARVSEWFEGKEGNKGFKE